MFSLVVERNCFFLSEVKKQWLFSRKRQCIRLAGYKAVIFLFEHCFFSQGWFWQCLKRFGCASRYGICLSVVGKDLTKITPGFSQDFLHSCIHLSFVLLLRPLSMHDFRCFSQVLEGSSLVLDGWDRLTFRYYFLFEAKVINYS